jgi:hypothetical protein
VALLELPIDEHFFCVVREPDHQLRAVTTEALREFLEQFFLDRLLARLPAACCLRTRLLGGKRGA